MFDKLILEGLNAWYLLLYVGYIVSVIIAQRSQIVLFILGYKELGLSLLRGAFDQFIERERPLIL